MRPLTKRRLFLYSYSYCLRSSGNAYVTLRIIYKYINSLRSILRSLSPASKQARSSKDLYNSRCRCRTATFFEICNCLGSLEKLCNPVVDIGSDGTSVNLLQVAVNLDIVTLDIHLGLKMSKLPNCHQYN